MKKADRDVFLPDVGWRLQAAGKIADIACASARKATVPTLIAGGFLIGLSSALEPASQAMGAADAGRRRGGDGIADSGDRMMNAAFKLVPCEVSGMCTCRIPQEGDIP